MYQHSMESFGEKYPNQEVIYFHHLIKTCLFVLQDKKLTSYGLMALYFHGL